jgi:hypothetical protein
MAETLPECSPVANVSASRRRSRHAAAPAAAVDAAARLPEEVLAALRTVRCSRSRPYRIWCIARARRGCGERNG